MRFILYFLLLVAPPVLADQNADFLAAHDAFLAGDTAKLERYAQRLKKTPLEVYVSYYQLNLALEKADAKPVLSPSKSSGQALRSGIEGPISSPVEKAVKNFLARPEDTPIIDQLRGEWLKLLGNNQQWDLFDAEYPRLLNEDTDLTCYALQSRRRSQELAALRDARKLWFTGKGQPDSCGTLFDAARSAGIISEQDVDQRLRLALETNNVSFAIQLAEQQAGKYAGLSALLKSAAADPDRYLRKLTPDNSNSIISSDLTATPARISAASEAQGSGIEQPSPSAMIPENALPAPRETTPSPPAGWLGNFLSRLGFGKTGKPASTGVNTELKPPPEIHSSGGPGAECAAPCVDAGDDYAVSPIVAVPPIGMNSKLASKGQRTVALFALERLAKQSPDLAAARWAKIAGYFSVSEQHYFYGRLAYQAARNLDGRALRWYKAAADTPLDDHQSAWRVRAALRAQDWPEVLASVNAMSEQQQREAAWQYWKARALQALGRPIEAREIFAPLSGEFNFYGQMASAELADFPVLSETIPVYKPDNQAITEISALPGVRRTLALYRMDMHSEALEEWRWLLRNFNDRELLTAAEIARRNEMYDRAIGAADKTVNVHDFSLRYLAPYRSELRAHILEHGLDEAWVYGLMRQESRFATGAKSDTGASGLMQIMPGTARWVANKLGLTSYRNALIHQLDTNLRIGTYYMKSVLTQSENSPVLASAAYNAGPIRALQWRGDRPLEGAIYVETIPFEETRDYVKKVMSNTVYYADQFGNPPRSLKQRLGVIAARTADNQAADNKAAVNKTAGNQIAIPNNQQAIQNEK
jgi:soluble lytic murein transglycosylase-like protein